MRFRALRRASAPCAKGGTFPWDPQTLQRLRMALFGVVVHSKKENCEVFAVAKSSRNVTSGDGVAEAVNAAFKPYDEYGLDEDYKYTETKELLKERLKDVPVKNIITPPLRITVPVLHGITHCMEERYVCGNFGACNEYRNRENCVSMAYRYIGENVIV